MKHSDPSLLLAPHDKLSVFISSTIGECAAERKSAEKGIRGTNHVAVLFEKLGSRPYYPREVYLSKLRQAQIVVAIYKNSYGYIDEMGGMNISGLEDELRSAQRFGIPLLVYINRNEAERDLRLKALVMEVMSQQTVAFYDAPTELEERIKDDITALTTQRFFDAAVLEDALSPPVASTIDRSAPPGGLIARPDLIASLSDLLAEGGIVQIVGEAGSGKTVILSQMASNAGRSLVVGTNLSPKETFGILANQLRPGQKEPTQFATYEGARHAFASAWADSTSAILYLDDSPHIEAVIDAIGAMPRLASRSIVFSRRDALETNGDTPLSTVAIPPLSQAEIRQLLHNASRPQHDAAVLEMMDITGGNPLRVRQEIIAAGRSVETVWSDLVPRTREIVIYLTVAGSPIEIETLLALTGDTTYSVEQLFDDMDRVPEIAVGTGNGYRIVHESVRDELYAVIERRPERLQFAAKRISKQLTREGRAVPAYFVLARAKHPDAAKLLDKASFEAARSGDWKAIIEISTAALARSIERVDNEETIHVHLALAQALEMAGRAGEARPHLEAAKEAAKDAGEDVNLDIELMLTVYNAHHELTQVAIQELTALRGRLIEAGRPWQAARISLELSATYINVHQSEAAATEARAALATFEEVKDRYGASLARKNLASALVSIDAKSEEADRLIREIELSNTERDGRRSRAWLCNVMVRKNRVARQYGLAEKYAREAMAIGAELGDEALVALNGIGLGNIFRDQDKYQEAIETYNAAAVSGQKCGRHDIEAHASYLAANTYNEIPEGHALNGDAPTRAEMLARQAIGLMRDTVADDHLGRAYEALADALFEQRRKQEAIEALFAGAQHHFRRRDWDNFERLFLTGCHNSNELPEVYLRGIDVALNIGDRSQVDGTRLELFYRSISDAVRLLPHDVVIPFLGLHIHRMIDGIPPPIVRRVVDLILQDLRALQVDFVDESWRILFPALILATACSPALTNQDYLRIAEAATDLTNSIYARPECDGGAVWTVSLSLPALVAVTVIPMDDSAATTLACLQLALFLKGFEADLGRELLGGISVLGELTIMVASAEAIPHDLRLFVAPHLQSAPCCVTRLSPGEVDDSSVPTSVFLAQEFMKGLVVGAGRGGSLQLLLGLTMNEVAFRLLGGSVNEETLRPKLVKLVRQTIS